MNELFSAAVVARPAISPRLAAYAISAWLFFLIGLVLTILGPTVPAIRRTFDLDLAAAGLLFVAQSGGYMVAIPPAGYLVDARGRRLTAALGAGALAVGAFLMGFAPAWPVLLAGSVLSGIGFACADVAANALVSDASGPEKTVAMNLAHAFFALATLLGPLGLGFLLSAGVSWRIAYALVGMAALPALLIVPFTPFPAYTAQPLPGLPALLRLAQRQEVWRAALVLGLYVGAEVSIAGWLVTFLQQQFGWSEALGSWALSGYWSGFLGGRLLIGILARRLASGRLLRGCCVGALLSSLLGAVAPWPALAVVCYTVTGVSISGIFPTVMAITLQRFPAYTGAVTALLIMGGAVGSTLLPGTLGAAGQLAGMRGAMLLLPLIFAAMLVLVVGTNAPAHPVQAVRR
jgi:FHS family glucose/mannose:H+ symporter-like MFS transporter